MSGVRVAVPIWRVISIGAVAVGLVASDPADTAAQHDHRAPVATRAEFRVDAACKPEVARLLRGGVALLHLGRWDAAIDSFRLVTHSDVDCVLGWWGAAMAWWGAADGGAGPEALARGRAAILSARLALRGSPRERRYVDAAELLYDGLARGDMPSARRHYESAMERLSGDYPDDDNAALVAAVALAERPEESPDAAIANRLSALASLRRLQAAVDHPAVVRAMLVAGTHPAVVPRVAGDALRVLRQTDATPELLIAAAEVMAAGGRWAEAVDAGHRATDAALGTGRLGQQIRAMDTVVYALLQQGRNREADAIAGRLQAIGRATAPPQPVDFGVIPVIAVRIMLERGTWTAPLAMPDAPDSVGAAAVIQASAALAAARDGDRVELAHRLTTRAEEPPSGPAVLRALAARLRTAAEAWQLALGGRPAAGEAQLREAARLEGLQPGAGPSVLVTPPALELLAEYQLEFGAAREALDSFEAVLAARPGRLRALYGGACAAAKAGNATRASELFRNLGKATAAADDPPRSEVAEARIHGRAPGLL